jgi:energy-coupling factor transport system substrate-specific component
MQKTAHPNRAFASALTSAAEQPRGDAMAQTSSRMMRAAVFSAACIAINVGLSKVAAVLQLPVFMDTVGTILSGAMVPPSYSILVGIVSNLIGGVVTHPAVPFYIGTQVVVSLMSIVGFRRGWFDTLPAAIGLGLAIGIATAIVSAPITVLAFGGVTEPGATALNAVLLAAGYDLWTSVLSGTLVVSSVDKVIAAVIGWALLRRMPDRLKIARPAAAE